MRRLRILFFLILGFISPDVFSQTQADLNQTADEAYVKADKDLNNVYQLILKNYSSDTVFIKNLKSSQRIWIAFRDAELKMKYPEREAGYYGSIQPMCVSNFLEQLTRQRISTLQVWLDGTEEGDPCSGSVKVKD